MDRSGALIATACSRRRGGEAGSSRALVRGREALRDTLSFRGHPMVRAAHPTTIEVTTEDYLTENGDCIIGVRADKGCLGLEENVKDGLRKAGAKVRFRISVADLTFEVSAEGDPRLGLSHPHEIVIRKSDFVSGRTVAVRADASSRDIPRGLVRLLKDPRAVGRLDIEVAPP